MGQGPDSGPNPRELYSEADFLAEGFAANLATFKALQIRARLSNDEAAQLCGVSPRTYRRWRASGKPNAGAVRLLAVLAGYVPWDGWQGWEVHGGFLFPPGFSRHGIAPGEFFAIPYYRQALSAYRERVAELEAKIRVLEENVTTSRVLRNAGKPLRDAQGNALTPERPETAA